MSRPATAGARPPDGAAFRQRFLRHLQRSAVLHGAGHVVVAYSGGLDSTVLLHLLRFHVPALRITAAHYDHALRPDSAADADRVRGVCAAWQVPLVAARADRPPAGEAAARTQRYAFLHDAAARIEADTIVTAHHADDQAETVLFRLARGTGVTGLAGIPQRRGIIARPLLPFTRADLLAYAVHARLRWREDPTNVDVRFARNRIRHVVLPALEAGQPGAARRIAAVAARMAEAESAWRALVADAARSVVDGREDNGFVLARERLLAYHPHIRARVLRHLLGELGSRPDRAGTRVAMEFINSGVSGGTVDLAGGVQLRREFDRILLLDPRPATHDDTTLEVHAAAPGAGSFRVGGRSYEARWGPASGAAGSVQTASFDPSSLRFPLELRAWRAGDRIRLAYGSKKLKKLFQERRVGRSRRERTAVLSDAAGEVLWVVGIARAVAPLPQGRTEFHVALWTESGRAGERESGGDGTAG